MAMYSGGAYKGRIQNQCKNDTKIEMKECATCAE